MKKFAVGANIVTNYYSGNIKYELHLTQLL
jgi:hypothetical protein